MATEWRLARRHFLQDYKQMFGCVDCGYNEHPAALQFDHVRGEKLLMVSTFEGASQMLLDEIEKCEIVCANCHSIRTWMRLVDYRGINFPQEEN